jgi:hypothetical protein
MQTLPSGAAARQAVSAYGDLSWQKWSSAYAVCRYFFKDQKWPKSRLEGVLKITCLKRCDPTITHDVPLATAPCSPYYDALWPCTWEVYGLCRKFAFSRQNPKIVYLKINDLRVQTFLFSVICDRAGFAPPNWRQ